MRTSSKLHVSRVTIGLFFAGFILAATGTNCLSGDECLRYSDCSEGLTCAFGKCVVPPVQDDEGGVGEGGSTTTDSGSTTNDSGITTNDSGSNGDASDDGGDASDDAGDAGDAGDGG
ncbi:MAG TPA: hypothetical protein VF407_10475 [Polyangiaceae bacterium]